MNIKFLILLAFYFLPKIVLCQSEYLTKSTSDLTKFFLKTDPLDDSLEYIIRKAIIYASKQPSEKEIKNTPAKLWLLRIYFYKSKRSKPLMLIERNGKNLFVEYEPVKTFESDEEALEFAKKKNIKDIELE